MVSKVYSCSFTGIDCRIIEVQADISNGLPSFSIVGLGDASVQESKERVRSSIKNSGAKFPQIKKTINLAPAQVKKQGALFDLPIAISILTADNQIPKGKFNDSIIVGELSLTGKIKRINGALAIVQHAQKNGYKKIFLPKENAQEASYIEGIEIFVLEELKELIDFSLNIKKLTPYPYSEIKNLNNYHNFTYPLKHIIGQEKAKRGLSISAAGGHNTLLFGTPGCGKTILCRGYRSLLPPMSKEEILQTSKIFSIAGQLDKTNPIITKRPFREVHHTASTASIIGGGSHPKPGEITLAHNGVLFLDEIAEFSTKALEALRQPLEDKYININRVNNSSSFPCDFVILATMNPCPCGYHSDKKIKCICSQNQINKYKKRLSGPLLDRFDIFLEISRVKMEKIFFTNNKEKQNTLLRQIQLAHEMQKERFKKQKNCKKNSRMNLALIKKFCPLKKDAKNLLESASEKLNLSNRGYLKTIKLSRTIADLDNSNQIKEEHIAEAIQFRKQM